ncbi:MAG TPA: RecQ family ATP-dependent DNA helicase [Gemmataceae bacterium]|nr:RecQ family ATP-dependent DNA helicase [Gemmataceae bacterium]
MPPTSPAFSLADLKRVIERYWGYHTLRPLQEQAMRADLEGRDSLVVMPTGGGKSLCYQAPAALRGAGMTVVLSPLIALMKDQVDGLQACGVPAIQIDSSQSSEEQWLCKQMVLKGEVRLLFISPERLVNTEFYQILLRIGVRTFAIDEAHCISHWGHDFRPEYRQLSRIKELFPGASVHAYTATATEQVRHDIAVQLALRDPDVLVGNFDRPNLIYRVLPRQDRTKQVLQVLERHQNEAGIIYCPFTREVDDLTAILRQHGYDARRYHANRESLSDQERRATQEAFMSEACDLVVATIAFGMGIDRSNIRFVLHTAMPKSLEHYQQESGRAGRDGLEAECVLLHSGADFMTWKSILEKNAEESGAGPEFLDGAMQHLGDVDRFARGATCRHRALVEYFGQTYEGESCSACDVCLGDTAELPDARVVAQKILSCVARVEERFGIGHVISVLRGEEDDKVRKFRHDKLTTYGLLKDRRVVDIRDWIYQLISQKALVQHDLVLSDGRKVPILKLTPGSWEVMRGQREVRLLQLVRRKKGEKAERSKVETVSWEGVDRGLFEELKRLRQRLAQERNLAGAYLVFGDRTLRELARVRPTTLEGVGRIYGVGEAKLRDYGEVFLQAISAYCRLHGLTAEPATPSATVSPAAPSQAPRKPAEARAEPESEPARPRDESKPLANSLEIAQKILSCVAKVKGPFSADHVARVLRGGDTEQIRTQGHDKLSTYGLLKQYSRAQVQDWIDQLIERKVLVAEAGPNPILRLNDASWAVMRGQTTVRLVALAGEVDEPDPVIWEGVDRELYESLADLRDRLAEEAQVAARAVLGDWVLRELARVRPSSLERMRFISGLGDAKINAHGSQVLHRIVEHCRFKGVPMDQPSRPGKSGAPARRTSHSAEEQETAFALYRLGTAIDEVVRQTEWKRDKAIDYLCDFIRQTRPSSINTWVSPEVQQRVAGAARQVGTDKLKPIYLLLGEKIPYDDLRLVVSHLLSAHDQA